MDRNERREDVLLTTVDEQSSTVGEIAYCLNYAPSTVRRDLETLEELGLVRGVKHDERRILPNGRVRVYWSATDRGRAFAEEIRKRRASSASSDQRATPDEPGREQSR